MGLSGNTRIQTLPPRLIPRGQRHARGLDLPIGQPAGFERHQAEVAEGDRRPAPRQPAHPAALLLAVFDFLRHQHNGESLSN
jgi:hypothetical protein